MADNPLSAVPDRIKQGLAAFGRRLDPIARTTPFRIAVASVCVAFHLIMFAAAGRDRLDLPFNSAPANEPYYSDPDASVFLPAPRQPHYWSRLIVSRWDAQHYIGFAVRGLTSCPEDASAPDIEYMECGLAWFPAYGKAGGIVADTTGIPADIALLLISLLAALALNLLWTTRTMIDRMGLFEAYATLVAFNVFPSAFYIVTPYTEGITLALAMGGFLSIANERWLYGALLIGTTTALRPTAFGFGIAFGVAGLVYVWRNWRGKVARWWQPLLSLPLAGWGLAANLLLLHIFTGDAFAFMRAAVGRRGAEYAAQVAAGVTTETGRSQNWIEYTHVVDPEYYVSGFGSQHMDMVVVIGTFLVIALAGRDVLRRFKVHEAVFLGVATVVMILLPLKYKGGFYWGLNRYFLLVPLTFLCAGVVARKHKAVFVIGVVLSLSIYWHVELCSYIAQGHPAVCPCLGKIEAVYPF